METEIVFQIYRNNRDGIGWRDMAMWSPQDFDASTAWGLGEYYATEVGLRNVRLIKRTVEVVTLESLEGK